MGKLSSAIVQRKLASLRDVEEALARQVLYGGDLTTNLLEQVASIDEQGLMSLLAETQGLPPAPAGELPRAPSEARLLVPGDVALRHCLYPLEHSGSTLVIAVVEPLEPEVEQDLSFGLGVTIVQHVAPFVRIRQALGREYGMPLDRRSLRVLAKLEGRPDPSPSIAPAPLASAPDMAAFPRPPSIPALGLPAPTDMSPLYTTPYDAPAPSRTAKGNEQAVAILPITPLGPVTIAEPARPLPDFDDGDGTSIHERLTSPAPAVAPNRDEETVPWPLFTPGALDSAAAMAARVTAPAPPPRAMAPAADARAVAAAPDGPPASRRAGSGQYAIPLGALAAWSVESKSAEQRRARARARRRGPYTTANAEQDLLAAEGRDDVIGAFFAFANQYFEYSALFAVHGDLAEGREASGPGADHSAVTGIGVPLDMPGALRTARNERRFNVVALADDGLDARLATDLLRKTGKKVLLMPILVRERCVLIFYGDDGDDDVELSEIGDVIAFAPLVAAALENVILRKKVAVRKSVADDAPEPRPPSARPPMRPRSVLPSREERVEALSEALQSTVRPVSDPPPPRRAITPPPVRPPTPAQGTPRHASVPPPPATTTPAAKPPSTRPSATLPEKHSFTKASTATPLATPAAKASRPAPSPTPADAMPGPVFSLSRRSSVPVIPATSGPMPETASSASAKTKRDAEATTRRDASPVLETEEQELEEIEQTEAPEISIGTAEVDWSPEQPEPDSRVVVATQLPIKRHSSAELRLPTVIVNVDADIEAMVRRLIDGDESVLDRLVSLGAPAASVLVARFPGPTKADSDRLGAPTAASQRGPLLKALARIGHPAVPFVAVRSSDKDPTIRVLATLLLGEIPSADSAQAIARRVTDSVAEVRRAALEASRLLQGDDEARTTLRDKVLSLAEDASGDIETRVAAIEALAHARDPRAVPRLVRLVPQNDEVGQSAQWALGVITRQAFGRDAAAWDAWWGAHQSEHRIVWLMDALMHEDHEIRRAAGEELKALTKEYFGYYDDLSKKEREKAQKRYREWWEATGKARFSG